MLACAAIMIVSLAWKNRLQWIGSWGAEITVCQWLWAPCHPAGVIVETDNAGLATAVYPLRRGGGFGCNLITGRNLRGTCDQLAGQTIMKNRCQDWFQRLSSVI